MRAIINGSIFTGEEQLQQQCILVADHKIVGIVPECPSHVDCIDLEGKYISPGFIDIQINGGRQRHFSKTPDIETLAEMHAACVDFATPFLAPTLISSPQTTILTALEAVKSFMDQEAGVLGMHLEGPFMNPLKKGAHDENIIRKPTDRELDAIIEQGKGCMALMTIAPECFTDKQIEKLLHHDIVLSAGHSMMSYAQAQHYFSMGIHLVTHLFNAMTQMGHRECGTVGAVFNNSSVYAPIILDGGHCDYAAAKIAYQLKKDTLFLITDSSFLGRELERFNWEGLNIEMKEGFFKDQQGNLAGAAISMPEAIKNAIDFVGIPLQVAVEMATSRPARAIRQSDRVGFIKPGYPAMFSVFNADLSDYATLSL